MMSAKMRGSTYTKGAAFRFWGSLSLLIFAIMFSAMWLGGFLPNVQQAGQDFTRNRLMSAGFVVDRIDVMGEGRLREEDVKAALQIETGDYLFGTDLKEAKTRVESLSWVDDALVRRLWPNRIVVQIIEREPFALWQVNGQVRLVDANGIAIVDADPLQYTQLPLAVGVGAATAAPEIHKMLAGYPEIFNRVNALVYVNENRWDVLINDRAQKIKLPADNASKALEAVLSLHAATQILDRQIAVIDMRLPDRVSLSAMPSETVMPSDRA
ncbi:MAG: cell division protein FtsQ/DivIB [Maricaulaceae bacterium]